MADISQDASYKKIEEQLIGAARAIIAHTDDRRAWAQFCKDHPGTVARMKSALTAAA